MRKIKRVETGKLSISLPLEMVAWLKEEAETGAEMGNVSAVLRHIVHPVMVASKKAKGAKTPEPAAPNTPHGRAETNGDRGCRQRQGYRGNRHSKVGVGNYGP